MAVLNYRGRPRPRLGRPLGGQVSRVRPNEPTEPEQIRSERPSSTPHALTLNDPNKQLRRHQTTFGGATQGRRICIHTEVLALAGRATALAPSPALARVAAKQAGCASVM